MRHIASSEMFLVDEWQIHFGHLYDAASVLCECTAADDHTLRRPSAAIETRVDEWDARRQIACQTGL
jgi:hypothetical protein